MVDLSNKDIVHVKGKEVEYLQFRRLLDYSELVHCYTLSANDFDVAGNDTMRSKEKIVIENYKKISAELGINYNNIIRPYQTHTDRVSIVNKKVEEIDIFGEEYREVDGLLTDKKDIVFSLGYADCIPLFLYDPVKKIVGNIHSGWKGTLQRIGQKAIYKMVESYGCKPEDIICCIGPSIRKCHFEVSADVKEMFYNEFVNTDKIDDIIVKKELDTEKYYIDTVLINKIMMQEAGLKEKNIIDSKICTVCNYNFMHSYRVAGENAGRNTAIIGLK